MSYGTQLILCRFWPRDDRPSRQGTATIGSVVANHTG